MESFVFGKTALGLPIPAFFFGTSGPAVLILGGVHGDEPEGVAAALGLLGEFSKSFPFDLCLTIAPTFNLDGILAKSRLNGNSVDLNRNLPTKDWNPKSFNPRYPPGPFANSEPENQSLVKWLDNNAPQFVLSLHSWNPLLNINGECREEAEAIQSFTSYKIEETIGYPTPGCLGTYAGIERGLSTLTYEVERGLNSKDILATHVPAIIEGLKVTERKHRK